jgi:hypothetical protein
VNGTPSGMATTNNQQEQQAAARQAKREGIAPSAAGATTGAAKQIDHSRHGDDRHENSSARGKSKT